MGGQIDTEQYAKNSMIWNGNHALNAKEATQYGKEISF
jgi:hypothetical protein